MLLPHENARFVLGGPAPILLLGSAPIHAALPPLQMADGRMPACEGWTLLARLTLCVVDGPGEAGCLVPTLGSPGDEAETAHVEAWCGAVEQTGGAVVLSLDAIPAEIDWNELFTSGHAHGGFVRTQQQ